MTLFFDSLEVRSWSWYCDRRTNYWFLPLFALHTYNFIYFIDFYFTTMSVFKIYPNKPHCKSPVCSIVSSSSFLKRYVQKKLNVHFNIQLMFLCIFYGVINKYFVTTLVKRIKWKLEQTLLCAREFYGHLFIAQYHKIQFRLLLCCQRWIFRTKSHTTDVL